MSSSVGFKGLIDTMDALPKKGYYFGSISIREAESILVSEPNGAFLVRDASEEEARHFDTYCITFKLQNRYGSIRVDFSKGYFSLSMADKEMPMFRTMMSLVERYVRMSQSGEAVCRLTGHVPDREVDLFLRKPVNRLKGVHSLQHLCQATLHKNFTRDKLEAISSLPKNLEPYLLKSPYFDQSLYLAAVSKEQTEPSVDQNSGGLTKN